MANNFSKKNVAFNEPRINEDITGYDIVTGTLMDLNIKSVSNANMTLDINSGSTFRYGR